MHITPHHRRGMAAACAVVAALALASCASPADDDAPSATATEAHDEHDHEHDHDETAVAGQVESADARIVVTFDGGVGVFDADTLDEVAHFELAGFNRINPLGDGRHVAVSTAGGWAIVDAGAWTEPHGDHTHSYAGPASLTDVLLEAEAPGHVVVHDGLTALWDDGTGQVTVVEVDEWTESVEHGHVHTYREYTADEAHHGVAVAEQDGTMLVTLSDRSGAQILDGDDNVVIENANCPGVHGETAFTGADGTDYMVVGCTDGVLIFEADGATKVASPDAEMGRIGNQFSTEGSDIVLGDYRNDPDAGIAVSLIALVNAASASLEVVDPFQAEGVATTWRGLLRGDGGEVLVLGTDGALRVIDPATGAIERTIDVIGEWEVPEEWQTAHPALAVLNGMVYVTEPATHSIHIVDYVSGEVWKSVDVGHPVTEIVGVTG